LPIFPAWEQNIPRLGIKFSHAGNKIFPGWEFFWGNEIILRRGLILIHGVASFKKSIGLLKVYRTERTEIS